jgi:hypothetical protein
MNYRYWIKKLLWESIISACNKFLKLIMALIAREFINNSITQR